MSGPLSPLRQGGASAFAVEVCQMHGRDNSLLQMQLDRLTGSVRVTITGVEGNEADVDIGMGEMREWAELALKVLDGTGPAAGT